MFLFYPRQTQGDYSMTAHKKKMWDYLELSNTLIVNNVTLDHHGDYTCTASSGKMEKSATASLIVYGESHFSGRLYTE